MRNYKRQRIYLIILVATLILFIMGSTYAFMMRGGVRFGDDIGFGTTTAAGAIFTSYAEGNLVLDMDKETMDPGADGEVEQSSSTMQIILDGGSEDFSTTCAYDIMWVWDSDYHYTESSVPLPYVDDQGILYPYEFTVKIGGTEKNLSSLEWDGNKAVIFSKSITAHKNEITRQNYDIVATIYNIPVVQTAISGRILYGHIEVSQPYCTQAVTMAAVSEKFDSVATSVSKLLTRGQGSTTGNGKLFHLDGKLENSVNDDSYRYTGANPDNFMCFQGTDCTDPDNLYRIIGKFGNDIRVVKYTAATSMAYGGSANTYADSAIDKYLNETWLATLGDNANLIREMPWYVDGFSASTSKASVIYGNEIKGTTIKRKVALAYASDYAYATDNSNWATNVYDYHMEAKNTNWMLDTTKEQWLLTKSSADTATAYRISTYGDVRAVPISESKDIRPCFYLREGIKYISGTGTEEDPLILADWPSAQFVKAIYDKQGTDTGNGKLYLHDDTLANSAGDGSYRYSGANPNNYVCFKGYDCTAEDSLFRIIGAYGKNLKLVKYTPTDTLAWNDKNANTWADSSIATFLKNWVNTSVIIPSLIQERTWNVGTVNTWDVNRKAKGYYDLEQASTTTVSQKIGLIYPSDYGYAAESRYWNIAMNNYKDAAKNQNWLLDSKNTQWTMSSVASTTNNVFHIDNLGDLYFSDAKTKYAIKPTFYLNERTLVESGTGTKNDPYIIKNEDISGGTLYDTIMNVYANQGAGTTTQTIYLHNSSLANGANDGSYRYAGSNPNNYVCFNDGGAGKCTDANKFRIIGLFGDNVKLIKPISINKRNWDDSKNTWEGSAIEKHINSAYLNLLGGKKDLILNATWYLGGGNGGAITLKNMYLSEMNKSKTVIRKIGLMYASDIGYASLSNYWDSNINTSNNSFGSSWLRYITYYEAEWLISHKNTNSSEAYVNNYSSSGSYAFTTGVSSTNNARPTFYINASIPVNSGNGTSEAPYLIG